MHVFSLRRCLYLAVLLFAVPCHAQVITLGDALQEAVENNPVLRAAKKDIDASEASRWNRITPAYPRLFYEFEGVPEGRGFSDYEGRKMGISQEIEFPLSYYLAGKKVDSDRSLALHRYNAVKNEISAEVKKRYYELLFHSENCRMYSEIRALSLRMLDMARSRVLAGESAPYDTLRAKVDLVDVESLLLGAERDSDNARYSLKLLLGRGRSETIELSGGLPYSARSFDPDELKALAMSSRPELKEAVAGMESRTIEKKLAFAEQLPAIEISYFNHRLPNSATPDNWGGGIGLRIPLWGAPKGTSAVKAASYRRDAAGWRIEALKREVLAEVDEAWSRLVLADSQVKKYRESALSEAEELARIATISYEAGEMGYYESAEAYRAMYRTRASFAEALYTYHCALADLERAVGVSLSDY